MIPKLHYISEGSSAKKHLEHIKIACTSGIELVLLHLTNISENELLKIARDIKADGVHITTNSVCSAKARLHAFKWQSISATANSLLDCETAIGNDLDYIYLGPFSENSDSENLKENLD